VQAAKRAQLHGSWERGVFLPQQAQVRPPAAPAHANACRPTPAAACQRSAGGPLECGPQADRCRAGPGRQVDGHVDGQAPRERSRRLREQSDAYVRAGNSHDGSWGRPGAAGGHVSLDHPSFDEVQAIASARRCAARPPCPRRFR
jgi:hypothetical protein